jgi:hypothetical protein
MQCDLPPWRPRIVQSELSSMSEDFSVLSSVPKRDGGQRILQAAPICRCQRLLHALDGIEIAPI